MKQIEGAIVKNYSKAKMAKVKKHESAEKKSGHEKMEKVMSASAVKSTPKPIKLEKSKKQPHPNVFEVVRKMMKKGK